MEDETKKTKGGEEIAKNFAKLSAFLFDVYYVTFGKLKVFVTKQSARIHLDNGLM